MCSSLTWHACRFRDPFELNKLDDVAEALKKSLTITNFKVKVRIPACNSTTAAWLFFKLAKLARLHKSLRNQKPCNGIFGSYAYNAHHMQNSSHVLNPLGYKTGIPESIDFAI